MFKNHPKGLFIAFFTNMGERFGFYTMMAILVLFLQAKYGLSAEIAGDYYSWFYFAIYALALVGGLIADKTKKYKQVIFAGQIIMFLGYLIIAVPGMPLALTLSGLFVIALGNGLFKGNLQAVVGQLYDDPKYSKLRDSAFMVFYMGINIGAFFAPYIAKNIKEWWLLRNGFFDNANLPSLCHQMLAGKLNDTTAFQELANSAYVNGTQVADLSQFASEYIDVFSRGYNWAFAIAACAMILSFIVSVVFQNKLFTKGSTEYEAAKVKEQKAQAAANPGSIKQLILPAVLMAVTAIICHVLGTTLDLGTNLDYKVGLAVGLFVAFVAYMFGVSTTEEKPRIVSLCLVFVVVIFFWMSFHQNGLTLTMFARDYTVTEVGPFTALIFNLQSILALIATIAGGVFALKGDTGKKKGLGALLFLGFGALTYYFYTQNGEKNPISPEVFQSFNPLYIVALTPLVMGFFAYLAAKGKEPSTPKKIGIGMIITACAFMLMLISSLKLVSPYMLPEGATIGEDGRVSAYWLMSTYLILTIAELFLSPMGLSFVSKVAPPRFQGLMQGGWLLATAVGNKFLFIGTLLWGRIDIYMLWGVFVICCVISTIFIFSIMKRLEKVTK